MSEPNSWRNEGERCKLLIAVNSQSVTAEQNGLTLVPEASVMPVVRAIKIMIGRKGFFGMVHTTPSLGGAPLFDRGTRN